GVEGLAAGRCDIGLGVGRGTDITRRVRGWFSLAVDDVELFLGITREDEIMMQKLVITAVKAQIKDDARASRLVAAAVLEPVCRGRAGQQFAMRPHGITIGDYCRERHVLTVVERDPRDRCVAAGLNSLHAASAVQHYAK